MASLNIYVNEPATKGKVVLHTSIGPLDVELWSKEAPLACRNFVQLGLEGYYDGCLFHRVIHQFMAQTGDPTGTGKGGESIYPGNHFKDEFHGRLRFTHRGLLGMASSGPDTNGSQFFITLDKCEWLDRKHTIFGKVTGNSLYNLPRFNDLEVDDKDRPVYPPKIERFEVLLEPFDDIVPRAKAAPAAEEGAGGKKRKRKEKKNLNLLSFGEEAAADEQVAQELGAVGARSSHDVLDDPRLSKAAAVAEKERLALEPSKEASRLRAAASNAAAACSSAARAADGGGGESSAAVRDVGRDDAGAAFEDRMLKQMQAKRDRMRAGSSGTGEEAAPEAPSDAQAARQEFERLRGEMVGEAAKEAAAKEAAASGKSAGGWKWRGKGAKDEDDDDDDDDDEFKGMSELEIQQAKYLQKKRESQGLTREQRQEATLAKLQMFQSKLAAKNDMVHPLRFEKKPLEAESASHYDSFDPLKHGGDESRALNKIKEREKAMLSFKSGEHQGEQ